MKQQIQNYSFNAAAKTVTFTDYTTIRLDSLLLITNVTSNVIIYNFASALLGGTVTDNVVTLTYDTTTMSDTDQLQIFYDTDAVPATVASITDLGELIETLNELNTRLTVIAGMANSGQPALRVAPISSVSTAVTGTVTVTNATIATVGGVPAGTVSNAQNNTLVELANINNVTT